MIAVQGPRALETLQPLFDQPLDPVRYYHLTMGRLLGRFDSVISRTGYTGEDGFELIVGAGAALEIWTPSWNPARLTESSPAGWGPAIRCGWKPACRCTATSFP